MRELTWSQSGERRELAPSSASSLEGLEAEVAILIIYCNRLGL